MKYGVDRLRTDWRRTEGGLKEDDIKQDSSRTPAGLQQDSCRTHTGFQQDSHAGLKKDYTRIPDGLHKE